MRFSVTVCFCLVFVQQTSSLVVLGTAKCCEDNLQVQESENSTLDCTANKTSLRFQIRAESYGFLKNQSDGECIDINENQPYTYLIENGIAVSKKPLAKPFSKCCPLGHVYSSRNHSCKKKNNSLLTESFIKSALVRIGLPQCKIIKDKKFESLHDFSVTSLIENMEDGTYCLDETDEEQYFVLRICDEGLHVCKHRRCFKKCCPDGQSYVGGGFCKDTFVHGLEIEEQPFSPYIENVTDPHELIYGAGCPKVSLMPTNRIQYSIRKNGNFKYFFNYSNKFVEDEIDDFKSYCIEHATKGSISGYFLFMCFGAKVYPDKFSFTLWSKILSCIFLIVTIVIYIYLGEIKSTFGKILINYCLALIFLMVTLLRSHTDYFVPDQTECKVRGFAMIFLNSAAFAWLNVMSVDIWCTFGTPKRVIGSDQRRQDLKKFLWYFLYGWGLPFCHMMLVVIFANTQVLPEDIQPYVGIYYCFLESRNYARTVFFLIPQLIYQIINTVLFIKTIIYCMRVKNEISRMNDSSRKTKFIADKERLILIVKLAVIMGIIWIFEVVTAFFENMKYYSSFTKTLEIVLDNIVCLQGIFIFLIFICKQKTFNALKTKLGWGGRRISTSLSVTQSSNANNGHYPMNKRQTTISMCESKL